LNLFDAPVPYDDSDPEGYRNGRLKIGPEIGASKLGGSIWELPPGQTAYPYHFHLADEELLVVVAGTPDLRTPEGERTLAEGEIVAFVVGESGAHQLVNRTSEPVRFLAVSTSGTPDLVFYPDSGKIWTGERRPAGGGWGEVFREADAADYYDGESPAG